MAVKFKVLSSKLINILHGFKVKRLSRIVVLQLCILCLINSFSFAQDSVINITSAMFGKKSNEANISSVQGWVFKAGNDTAWAAKELNTNDWEKRNPTTLTVKDLNSAGKVEGWFRIKIKITDSLNGPFYGLRMSTFAANDVYINGKLIFSTGNTGANGKPFKEYNYINKLAHPTDFKVGDEYTIALHYVDELHPFNSKVLKSQYNGLSNILIRITSTDYNATIFESIKYNKIFSAIWISICLVISFLLTLLYFQNSSEKNLRLIAITSTLYFITMFSYNYYDDANFIFGFLQVFIFNLSLASLVILTTIIIVRLFNRKINIALKVCLTLVVLTNIYKVFFEDPASNLSGTLMIYIISFLIAILIFYIFTSWKKLKGAQWAIATGVVMSLTAGLLVTITNLYTNFFLDSRILYYISVSFFCLSFPLALLVYVAMRFKEIINEVRENAQKVVELSEEKEHQVLNQKKLLEEEVNRQTIELRNSLENLKITQSQLIQSEKMASLGELTAGIAHEIQNPLNFINNFSEINNELIDELKNQSLTQTEAERIELLDDIYQNNEKITHHGKRADAIVKGMLQHSRKSDGSKKPTNINALCDEYLRLAYHGLRAKDKSFNANLKTDFDNTIGNINIIAQDIGRVILNLVTNAFFAVNDRSRQVQPEAKNFEPMVSISTKNIGNHIEIKISDNGNGIPQQIIDKIFQPFFTTKPTGQGTGLGLSLSYDIIKAHQGELHVDSSTTQKQTVFTLTLPII